ncbi:unnamed protein product (macronuclear) [Paramecium tetraurelia]|uniref:CBM20 domain-containing protein n=1 Tax=Paramecium tetraurelia TaxID=5888 RepID=A0DDS1_PARTE|nr:uncharacterized protein GSPATT00016029001 [Paramecium tetraurelia]CAK81188.1 unnamed protein product [Paramecium tetraurelia]|eukprot:XP_001448585.1 hypothetical protein (macronuclear) [Paramecium tetraurelia strain d4-2]
MLSFQLHYQLQFGDAIYISGDSDYFGNWSPLQAKRMKWNQGHLWTIDIPIHYFQYKYFVSSFNDPNSEEWEFGPNRLMRTTEPSCNHQLNLEKGIVDVWNHRKVMFQCYNPQQYPMFISGSSLDLGQNAKRVSMKQKQDISYKKILANVIEDKVVHYQFHVKTKKHYSSSILTLHLDSTISQNQNLDFSYKNYILAFCTGMEKIKRSIYQLDNHICYGYVPRDQNDFNLLRDANLHTIIEFSNQAEQAAHSIKFGEFNYFTLNFRSNMKGTYISNLSPLIQLLITKYHVNVKSNQQVIYICNNSLSHLRKYLQAYKSLSISK